MSYWYILFITDLNKFLLISVNIQFWNTTGDFYGTFQLFCITHKTQFKNNI